VYECTEPNHYNPMASMSFAGQEKTIHGFFHSFTEAVDEHGYPEFVYGSWQYAVTLCTPLLRVLLSRAQQLHRA